MEKRKPLILGELMSHPRQLWGCRNVTFTCDSDGNQVTELNKGSLGMRKG
jgi:hypothetical protein